LGMGVQVWIFKIRRYAASGHQYRLYHSRCIGTFPVGQWDGVGCFSRIWYKPGIMETITIDFDIPGLEISADNRWELSRVVDTALQDSGGRWAGCRYTEDTITIHAMVDDVEQARMVIRSAIEGHPVFPHID
jgi:hypothetical protein